MVLLRGIAKAVEAKNLSFVNYRTENSNSRRNRLGHEKGR